MRTEDDSYMEDVFDLASKYKSDDNFSYDRAMCGCRDIARIHGRPWEWVAGDFEIACCEIECNEVA